MFKRTEKNELLIAAHRSADFKNLRVVCGKYIRLLDRGQFMTGTELAQKMRELNAPKEDIDFIEACVLAYNF